MEDGGWHGGLLGDRVVDEDVVERGLLVAREAGGELMLFLLLPSFSMSLSFLVALVGRVSVWILVLGRVEVGLNGRQRLERCRLSEEEGRYCC